MPGGASLELTANTRGTFAGCLLTSRAVQRKAASPRGQGPLCPRGVGHCSGLACSHLAFDSPPGDELGAHSQKRIQRRLWNCPASHRAIVLPCSVSTWFFFFGFCLFADGQGGGASGDGLPRAYIAIACTRPNPPLLGEW